MRCPPRAMNLVMDAMNAVPLAPCHATRALCSRKKSVNQPGTQAFRPD